MENWRHEMPGLLADAGVDVSKGAAGVLRCTAAVGGRLLYTWVAALPSDGFVKVYCQLSVWQAGGRLVAHSSSRASTATAATAASVAAVALPPTANLSSSSGLRKESVLVEDAVTWGRGSSWRGAWSCGECSPLEGAVAAGSLHLTSSPSLPFRTGVRESGAAARMPAAYPGPSSRPNLRMHKHSTPTRPHPPSCRTAAPPPRTAGPAGWRCRSGRRAPGSRQSCPGWGRSCRGRPAARCR